MYLSRSLPCLQIHALSQDLPPPLHIHFVRVRSRLSERKLQLHTNPLIETGPNHPIVLTLVDLDRSVVLTKQAVIVSYAMVRHQPARHLDALVTANKANP